MKNRIRLTVVIAATALLSFAPARAEDLAHSLVGTWRLLSWQAKASDGSIVNLYGESPLGILIYDAGGHMSVQMVNPALPKCGTLDRNKCPDAEARAAFDGYAGYWGRYEVEPEANVVMHYREGGSVPDWIGTTLKRYVQLSGNRLTITTPPQQVNGVERTIVLVWERAE